MSEGGLTFGSLFAGIGGFDLGLERAGLTCKWQVEIDPFCRKVLEKHWPDVQRYDDVRTVGSELEYVDWICGGFPCQDLSSAGKRVGLTGARSGLYREFVRIVDTKRPSGVLIENVHHAWRQWVPVLRSALWTLGYPSLPIRVRASDFGAWHERSRVFVVAHVDPSVLRIESWRQWWPFWTDPPLFADVGQARCLSGADTLQDATGEWVQRAATADADSTGLENRQGCSEDAEQQGHGPARGDLGAWGWTAEPDVVRVVYGVPSRLHGRRMAARIAALGNTVIPQQVEWIGRRLMEAHREA